MVRLDGVRKSFGDNLVLDGIDLSVDLGEVLVVIGPSGSGKSTLLRCVNLLEPIQGGRIFLEGEEITRRGADVSTVRQRIGIVFQQFNLFPHLTAIDNLTLAARRIRRMRRRDAERRARELLATVGLLIYGILVEKWYMEEIAALFLGLGILAGIAGRLSASDMATSFIAGAKDVMNVTLIIAVGRAILIILKQAEVLDTVLQYAAVVISAVPRVITAHMMFSAQMVINFFVHSGTAQAALTMPLMAPLGDLVGITRQTVVLAFQLCEVINPILPTSAVTMGVLGVAKIPWEKWAKWFLPLMLVLILFSLIALVPAVLTHYGPF